ncbi:MAG: IS21 family transposase [Acidimicrobiales bacterium]|nr:IS21 family transposase [Acidimicrobiales bacterium]
MAKRSKVQLYEQIRRAHAAQETKSVRALAREFRVHRRDVRAALESAVPPPRKTPVRAAPTMDRFKPIIDSWLEEDQRWPRKQRHTARRVWQRLVVEHGADVGESTVRRYVKSVRERQQGSLVDVTVPQHHRLGAIGEVDFGEAKIVLAGIPTEVSLFVMRLSASGRGFCRAYLNESQDVFLDGHVRAFDRFGGVPDTVRYDNLKAAVVKVLTGRDRVESDRFVTLRSHYGFESWFCQPGPDGAHEKGGVEGEVGRFRRNHLVPVPHVESMDELNELIEHAMTADDHRFIAHRRITVGEHFELEAPALRALPTEAFDATTIGSHRVDTKSRVCVRQAFYSVPARYVRRRLDVRVGAEIIEVLDGATVVARHPRGRKGDEILSLDHYLDVMVRKPGALPASTPLARARASGAFTDTHQRFWDAARRRLGDRDGTRVLIDVLLGHRTIDAQAIVAGMTAALTTGVIDAEVVLIEARRAAENTVAPVIPIGTHPSFDRPEPSIDHYDQLLEGNAR